MYPLILTYTDCIIISLCKHNLYLLYKIFFLFSSYTSYMVSKIHIIRNLIKILINNHFCCLLCLSFQLYRIVLEMLPQVIPDMAYINFVWVHLLIYQTTLTCVILCNYLCLLYVYWAADAMA